LLEITLGASGYKVVEAGTGKEGIVAAATYNPSLILLDLGLPDEDGQLVLKKLREWFTNPIIVLSVRSSEEDIIAALDHGAIDYLSKPFRSGELMARIRSAFRMAHARDESNPVLSFQSLSIDLASHVARKNDELIKLTSTEFSLLALLAKNSGKVLTHQYILREVWGFGYHDQTQYLRVFVAQLRKKIEDDPASPRFIVTESGIGYRFSS